MPITKVSIKTATGNYETVRGDDLEVEALQSGIVITEPAPDGITFVISGVRHPPARRIIAGAFLPEFFKIERED